MFGNSVNIVVITDCGSTTTKAILIERVNGIWRQTYRGEAPTTVEAPVEDVTIGVVAALKDLGDLSGRMLIDESGKIIRPSKGAHGTDLYLSTSSAGGGLQMVVAGIVKRISARSAERAALGAGAIVADVISCDEQASLHDRVERLRKLRPDMVLLAGGTDDGATIGAMESVELLAAANPRPRFGENFKLPVIFAGNNNLADEVRRVLKDRMDLFVVANVRPSVELENLSAARDKIHDLFLEHVMQQAPGYSKLVEWADASIMPTPSAVGAMLQLLCDREKLNVICVDIGGATTDVFSVIDGHFNRTVSANLGLSYSAWFVLEEAGEENIARWLPKAQTTTEIRNQIMNKTIRPTTIPDSVLDLQLEQAIAKEALRLSFDQHKEFSTGLKGQKSSRNIDSGFSRSDKEESLVNSQNLDLIIGSGGVLSHAPAPAQTAAMLIDSFLPTGVTKIAKDSIFMLPHLGVLAGVDSGAAASVFDRDCIIDLCTCIAPTGRGRLGKPCLSYQLRMPGGQELEGVLKLGDVKNFVLPAKQKAHLNIKPMRGFDVGNGKGKSWDGEVKGGPCGLVLDGRGRPLMFDEMQHSVKNQIITGLLEMTITKTHGGNK